MSMRESLPHTCFSISHEFLIHAEKGDVIVNIIASTYPDGRLGQVFIDVGRAGEKSRSLHDAICIAVSVALQHGASFDTFTDKFSRVKYDPQGFVEGAEDLLDEGRMANSVLDYCFRWLRKRFPEGTKHWNGDVPANVPWLLHDPRDVAA